MKLFSFYSFNLKQRISFPKFVMESCCTIDCKRKGGDGLMNTPSLKFGKVTVSGRIKVLPSAHFIPNTKKKK